MGTGISFTVAILAVSTFSYDIHCMGLCGISQKVAGSIPDGAIAIFHRHNPSARTVALGTIQPLTENSTKNISWKGEGGRARKADKPTAFTDQFS
jgi:hypothetical protein